MKAGLTATPLNYRYQAPEIDHALEVSGASVLVAHAERDDVLAASKRVSELALGRISYGSTNGAIPRLEELMSVDASTPELPRPEPHTPAFIFFTSGSTGKPKGVTHTHETFGWIVASAVAGFAITRDDVFLPATSASHIAASSLAFAGLAAGAVWQLRDRSAATNCCPSCATRPSLLCMLPAPLFGLVRDHGAAREDFQSIRRCVSGGDKISAELEREFVDLAGMAIEEVYGMTETGTSTINPTAAGNRIGSIGQLAPGFEASIRDDKGVEVTTGTPGRLWIRSRGNTIGYWNRPDATAETIVDGWLDTGDLVAADEQNYFWFRGRKKQIIIHDGSNICPQEVEDSLLENTAVASGSRWHPRLDSRRDGARVRCLQAGGQTSDSRRTHAILRDRVGCSPKRSLCSTSAINAVGKVDRVALVQMADAAVNRHLS